MAVKIRLARAGALKKPFYRIVVANSRAPRDGAFIEKVGTFNPLLAKDHAERFVIKTERLEQWLKQGAIPSERVAKLCKKYGIVLPSHVESLYARSLSLMGTASTKPAKAPANEIENAAEEASPVASDDSAASEPVAASE